MPSRYGHPDGSTRPSVLATATLGVLLVLFGDSSGWTRDDSTQPAPTLQNTTPLDGATSQPIVVRTQSYEVHFKATGGTPIRWDIVDPDVTGSETGRPVALFDTESAFTRAKAFEIEIPSAGNADPRVLNQAVFLADRRRDDGWSVTHFQSPRSPEGLTVTKTYRIPEQGFESVFVISLQNDGVDAIRIGDAKRGLRIGLGPGLGGPPEPVRGVGSGLYSFIRPVLGTALEVRQLELDAEQTEIVVTDSILWGGIHRRYFLAALSPDLESTPKAAFSSSRSWINPRITGEAVEPADNARFYPCLSLSGAALSIAPDETVELRYSFFFGPKDVKLLRSASSELDDVLFPGLWSWMRWLCFGIMWLLDLLHIVIPNWGLSIIGLAVVIRFITLPLAQIGLAHQARIAAQQGEFKKRMAEINEKYKNDPKRRSQESWLVYREHGVGPVSTLKGCLWLIVQIPIFVALFNLLGQSFALRGASFLWIDDLAAPDRLLRLGLDLPFFGEYFNVLPFFMAATQVFVSNITASSQTDLAERAKQKWFMVILAVVFLILFYSFPAGLVLYWVTSNLAQLLQQWIVGKSTADRCEVNASDRQLDQD